MISVNALKVRLFQNRNFKVVLIVFAVGAALLFLFGQEKKELPKEKMNLDAPIYDVTKALDDKSLWLFKAEHELREQQKKQEQLTNELDGVKKNLESSKANVEPSNIQLLQERIQSLEHKLTERENHATAHSTEQGNIEVNHTDPNFFLAGNTNFQAPGYSSVQVDGFPSEGSIFSENLNLNPVSGKQTPHIDHYIPAGSYAKAVLLSGVDVSAGISSQTAPKPVLLRLVHKGSLPNKAVGKMKDCRIIAAAYGDLSSERAYMRLEKLSCTETDGHVIETDVDGYISGEDGKNGVRGHVVIRDAEVLKRGFMGGLLSGLGKASSQSFSSTSVSPFGSVNTSTAKGADLFKQAGAQGAGDAFELMAKYNIQRAEQYQPVIQISAGRVVDVVFHSGSQFGEKKIRSKAKEVNHSIPFQNEGENQ